MRAQIIRLFGEADVFEREELPRPAPGSGQVLIRVAASSVNTADVKARELGHVLDFVPDLPAVLGMDVAGTVDAIGPDVRAFTCGDAVYGCAGGVRGHGGALAEYLVADARLLAHKPIRLSMEEAAALPLVSITAGERLNSCLSGNGRRLSSVSAAHPGYINHQKGSGMGGGPSRRAWCRPSVKSRLACIRQSDRSSSCSPYLRR